MQEHGIRPTANRILILKALLQAGRPLSQTEIETALESVDKSIISRTLGTFREHHLLHTLSGEDFVRYEVCHCVKEGQDDDRHVQDDSELAKYAVLGHTLADLEGDLAKLRPGLKKQLLPAEKVRLEALALRAEHALMTFRFLAASKRAGKEGEAALAAAAKALHEFRVKNLHALGDEAASWYSKRNSEVGAWRKAGYLR